MRNIFLVIITILSTQSLFSQINEIGLFAGGSNFIGDVGSTQYLAPNNTAFGVVYKWNKHTRYAFRASLLYATLEGNDYKSDINARLKRDFSFTNNIFEASAGVEFNFVPYDLHK